MNSSPSQPRSRQVGLEPEETAALRLIVLVTDRPWIARGDERGKAPVFVVEAESFRAGQGVGLVGFIAIGEIRGHLP